MGEESESPAPALAGPPPPARPLPQEQSVVNSTDSQRTRHGRDPRGRLIQTLRLTDRRAGGPVAADCSPSLRAPARAGARPQGGAAFPEPGTFEGSSLGINTARALEKSPFLFYVTNVKQYRRPRQSRHFTSPDVGPRASSDTCVGSGDCGLPTRGLRTGPSVLSSALPAPAWHHPADGSLPRPRPPLPTAGCSPPPSRLPALPGAPR